VSRTLSEEAKGITASIQAGGDTPLATTAGPGASPFILSISERKLETVSGKRAVFFIFFQAYPAGRLSLAKKVRPSVRSEPRVQEHKRLQSKEFSVERFVAK
jgi:hypothetical protein